MTIAKYEKIVMKNPIDRNPLINKPVAVQQESRFKRMENIGLHCCTVPENLFRTSRSKIKK